MIKIFFVEDEVVVRNGIKNSINWADAGMEWVGEAADGELAWPLICQTKPDILVTDIKMPFMDGLELSRLVREKFPDTKIIILSGYNEFDYAKEAIQIGITDYLLKPITAAKLLEALAKVAQTIKEEKEKAKISMEYVDMGKIDESSIIGFLKGGLKSEIPAFMEEYFAGIGGGGNMESLIFRQYVLMKLYFVAAETVKELGCTSADLEERCGDINQILAECTTPQAAEEYVQKLILAVMELRDEKADQQYGSLLQDAVAYINQNYDDENMSLNTVASSVNLSSNHFSTVFSRQMKQTFIEYLTAVRMTKAKELLKTTALRSAEVAFSVGYKDPHYFSYLFKKTQGCTPTEYRQRN